MKLITFATHCGGRMDAFLASCDRNGIVPEIFGTGDTYRGHLYRLKRLYPIVAQMHEDEIVMFLDAFDSVVLAGAEEIEKRFLNFGTALLYGAETCCAPYAQQANAYPRSTWPPYQYLNAGGYIGYAGFLKRFWERLKIFGLPDEMNDQGVIVDYWLANGCQQTGILLDYGQEILCNLYGAEALVRVMENPERGLRYALNTKTGSMPCALHGSGGADMSAVYEGLRL